MAEWMVAWRVDMKVVKMVESKVEMKVAKMVE